MTKFKLVIANKNYSSWSMRAWVLLTEAGIPFEEVLFKFNTPEKAEKLKTLSPSGLVPVLWIDQQPVWDTLAIAETVTEMFPEKKLWPSAPEARRHARAITAEMHSGFFHLRKQMPMNIQTSLPGKGLTPESQKDIQRICFLWKQAKHFSDGSDSLLFGRFSIADAMYAPIATRFKTYGVDLPSEAKNYVDRVHALTSVKNWVGGAKKERDFVPEDEPYRAKD